MQNIRQATCHTLIIDESNDISSTKMLIFVHTVQYTADDWRLMTKTVFAGIIPLARCDSHSILKEIKKFYTTDNIDIQKMVMLTSDGAAVMLGKRNGVAKLLKNFVPHVIEQHCVAHREDLGMYHREDHRRCVVKSIPYARHWNSSKNRIYYVWQILS